MLIDHVASRHKICSPDRGVTPPDFLGLQRIAIHFVIIVMLTGQRVRLNGRTGITTGVIGRSPIHLLNEEERGRAARIKDLWIDIGAKDGAEARERVTVGDVAVIEQPPIELLNNRLIARGIDNRAGSYVALETLRLLAANRPSADVYAVAATQEEISHLGARTSAYALKPTVAIVTVDRSLRRSSG